MKKEITFAVDENLISLFENEIKVLGIDKNEAFCMFVNELFCKGTKTKPKPKKEQIKTNIENKILKWIAKADESVPYQIIHCFEILTDSFKKESCTKNALYTEYINHYNNGKENIDRFNNGFRQLCSNAPGAHGLIFKIDKFSEDKTVTLHGANKEKIIKLFLNRDTEIIGE